MASNNSTIDETENLLARVGMIKERIARNQGKVEELKSRRKDLISQLKESFNISTLTAAEKHKVMLEKKAEKIKKDLNSVISSIDQMTTKRG